MEIGRRGTYSVLLFDQIDNIRRIFGQHSTVRALNVLGQFLVYTNLLSGDSKDDIDRILFDFQIDLRNARIVQNRRMRIFSFMIQMTFAVIWCNHAAQLKSCKNRISFRFGYAGYSMMPYFSIASIMETGICGEDQQTTCLITPSDLAAAYSSLHDCVEATWIERR